MRAPVGEEAVESRQPTRLREGVTVAVPCVMQEPREPATLAERAERGFGVSPGQVHQGRSQRRHSLGKAIDEPGDDGGIDVPAQHREHRKLNKRALRNDRDVVGAGRGSESAPSLDAEVGELLPRFVPAGGGRRNEWVGHLSFVDPAGAIPTAGEQAREEFRATGGSRP